MHFQRYILEARNLGIAKKLKPDRSKAERGSVKAQPGPVKAESGAVKAEPGPIKAEINDLKVAAVIAGLRSSTTCCTYPTTL
jgi:hypothetical protein